MHKVAGPVICGVWRQKLNFEEIELSEHIQYTCGSKNTRLDQAKKSRGNY